MKLRLFKIKILILAPCFFLSLSFFSSRLQANSLGYSQIAYSPADKNFSEMKTQTDNTDNTANLESLENKLDDKQAQNLKLLLPSLFKNFKNFKPNHDEYAIRQTQENFSDHADLISVQSMALIGDKLHSKLIIQLTKKTFYAVFNMPNFNISNFNISKNLVDSDFYIKNNINNNTSIEGGTHQILRLILDNINPNAFYFPIDATGTAIQKIQTAFNSDKQLIISFLLAPGVDVQGLQITNDYPATLILDLGVGNSVNHQKMPDHISQGPYQKLVKIEKPLKSGFNTGFEQAQENQHQKNYITALNLLNQNKPQQALIFLKKFKFPDINAHQKYYILLAELYRRTGDLAQAVKIYQSLLSIEPENAILWAGLGICFESAGRAADAKLAYQKALNSDNLPLGLQQYITEQLAAHDREHKTL